MLSSSPTLRQHFANTLAKCWRGVAELANTSPTLCQHVVEVLASVGRRWRALSWVASRDEALIVIVEGAAPSFCAHMHSDEALIVVVVGGGVRSFSSSSPSSFSSSSSSSRVMRDRFCSVFWKLRHLGLILLDFRKPLFCSNNIFKKPSFFCILASKSMDFEV